MRPFRRVAPNLTVEPMRSPTAALHCGSVWPPSLCRHPVAPPRIIADLRSAGWCDRYEEFRGDRQVTGGGGRVIILCVVATNCAFSDRSFVISMHISLFTGPEGKHLLVDIWFTLSHS